jgi:hypothetical protein
VDALQEEELRAIEGADTGQIALIQQRFTNRAVGLSTDPPDSLVEVPIGAEEVWAKMSDNCVLISGRNQFHDGEPVADYVVITGREHSADLELRASAPLPTARVDLPHPVHLEVGVQGELIAEAEELMLTA